MKSWNFHGFLFGVWLCSLAGGGCQPSNDTSSFASLDPERLFVHEVHPLLERKCFGCHSADARELKGDLLMDSREALLAGGESGHAALVPGSPEESPVWRAVLGKDPDFVMPPKEKDRLSERERQLLAAWIAAGAPWPEKDRMAEIQAEEDWALETGFKIPTSGALSASWANRRYEEAAVWAFQPLTRPEVPNNEAAHAVDAFILQALQAQGLRPAPRADKRSLIRRATFERNH